jgi:hypothetical protein
VFFRSSESIYLERNEEKQRAMPQMVEAWGKGINRAEHVPPAVGTGILTDTHTWKNCTNVLDKSATVQDSLLHAHAVGLLSTKPEAT